MGAQPLRTRLVESSVTANEIQRPDATQTVRHMTRRRDRRTHSARACSRSSRSRQVGKQTVVVQHLTVAEAGPALIAGNLSKGGSGTEREASRNERNPFMKLGVDG
jgi:hypothetical protein